MLRGIEGKRGRKYNQKHVEFLEICYETEAESNGRGGEREGGRKGGRERLEIAAAARNAQLLSDRARPAALAYCRLCCLFAD